ETVETLVDPDPRELAELDRTARVHRTDRTKLVPLEASLDSTGPRPCQPSLPALEDEGRRVVTTQEATHPRAQAGRAQLDPHGESLRLRRRWQAHARIGIETRGMICARFEAKRGDPAVKLDRGDAAGEPTVEGTADERHEATRTCGRAHPVQRQALIRLEGARQRRLESLECLVELPRLGSRA